MAPEIASIKRWYNIYKLNNIMFIPTKIDNIWSFIFVSINQYANPKVINIVKNKTIINLGPRRNQYSLTLQCAKLFSLSNSICKLFKNSSNPGTLDKLNVSIISSLSNPNFIRF